VNRFLSKIYWSSGYGASAGSFGWCTANTTIDARLWKKEEPSAASGCVSATFPKIPLNATGWKRGRARIIKKLFYFILIDESAYGAFLAVAECEQNNSYICVVSKENSNFCKTV
jgi:hypothetical protein